MWLANTSKAIQQTQTMHTHEVKHQTRTGVQRQCSQHAMGGSAYPEGLCGELLAEDCTSVLAALLRAARRAILPSALLEASKAAQA